MSGFGGGIDERELLEAVTDAVREYCVGNPSTPVRVVVVTSQHLGVADQERIFTVAVQAVLTSPDPTVPVDLVPIARPDLPPGKYRVDVGTAGTREHAPDDVPTAEQESWEASIPSGQLQWDARWPISVTFLADEAAADGSRFRFALAPIAGWVAFGRSLGQSVEPSALDFGAARAIPGGRLVEVRLVEEGLMFRRTRHRPDYAIALNGRTLSAGHEVRGGWSGTLIYARAEGDAGGRTVLRYRLGPGGTR